MNPIFEFPSYVLRRQVFALTGKFRFYDPMENLVMFSEQKMFRLREDIRVFTDESKQTEVLMITGAPDPGLFGRLRCDRQRLGAEGGGAAPQGMEIAGSG